MTADQIAMQVYEILCNHFETDDAGFAAEAMRWRQLIERCGLTMNRAQGIASEVCGQNETLSPGEFLRSFETAAFATTKIQKEREKAGPKKCPFCRDTGYSTIYHRRDASLTECVGCYCAQGVKVFNAAAEAVQRELDEASKNDKSRSKYSEMTLPGPLAKPRFSSAVTDPILIDAIKLFHRHHEEKSEAWAAANGLAGKDESAYAEKYREITETTRKSKMFQNPSMPTSRAPKRDFELEATKISEVKKRTEFEPGKVEDVRQKISAIKPRKPNPPPQLNPEALALAVYDNGDQRNEWE